jgi:hypothetical protein
MVHINRLTNEVYFGNEVPPGEGWETVPVEMFNQIRASGWNPTNYIPRYRVTKDTITTRVLEAGKLPDLIALIATLPPEQQFLWNGFTWFWYDNPTLVGMCQQLQLDPAVILAQDPYL